MAVTEERKDQTGRRGFAGRFLGAVQSGLAAAAGRGNRAPANPSWQANNQSVVELNTKLMAASAQTIALLDRDIDTTTEPDDMGYLLRLIATRAQAADGLKAMQESMAHDQVNVDVEAGAHTDADVQALRQQLSQLHAANDQMRERQQQHGVPERLGGPSVGNRLRSKSPDPTLAGTFDQGFASGYMSLGQSRLYGDSVPGRREENPNWKENTEKAAAVNRAFMDSSADTLALLGKDIESMTDPSDAVDRAELEETHAEVAGARDTVEELMAEDQEHAGAQAWGWTDAELAAQQRLVGELGKIDQRMAGMREQRRLESPEAARQPGVAPAPGSATGRLAPVLNADAVQRATHRRSAAGAAKSAGRAVVMNPRHASGLQDLEDHQDDGLESGDGSYAR